MEFSTLEIPPMNSPSIDGAPMKCAHCQRPLPVQDNGVEAWRGRSGQLYCSELCFENAEQAAFRFTWRCDFCGGSLGPILPDALLLRGAYGSLPTASYGGDPGQNLAHACSFAPVKKSKNIK